MGIGHAIGHLRRRLLGPWQTSHPVAERCPLCDGLAQAQASYAACVPMRWAKAMPPTHHSRHHLLGPGLASHPSQTATPAESGSFASIALLLSLTSARYSKGPPACFLCGLWPARAQAGPAAMCLYVGPWPCCQPLQASPTGSRLPSHPVTRRYLLSDGPA